MPGADRSLLEEVGRLDQHLDRQSRGQHLHHSGVFRSIGPIPRDADEIIGEQRDVVRRQRALVEGGEERVVLRLDIRAGGLELGDRDRLDHFRELRQALAVRRGGRRAIVVAKLEGRRRAGTIGGPRIRIERLRLQHGKRMLDATASRSGQLVLGRTAADEPRHHGEIEGVAVRAAQRRAQRLGALPRLGVDERGAQDVRQPDHQPLDGRPEALRFPLLRGPPHMVEDAGGHRGIAIDDLAVELQFFGEVGQHRLGRRVLGRSEPRRGGGPELGQRTARARGEECSQFALEAQHVLPQPLAFEPAWRDLLQDFVDDRGQRAQRARPGTAVDQHQRKVVAQPREVAVAREEGGTQRQAVDRVDAVALPPPGREEEVLLVISGGHVHCGSLSRVRDSIRRVFRRPRGPDSRPAATR